MAQNLHSQTTSPPPRSTFHHLPSPTPPPPPLPSRFPLPRPTKSILTIISSLKSSSPPSLSPAKSVVKCGGKENHVVFLLRTCRNCKGQFDVGMNHPKACRFHTAHFGGETKRKFESVHTGGTMSTPNSGQVLQYWHCCGSEDPFDPGCTSAPHSSYDDE